MVGMRTCRLGSYKIRVLQSFRCSGIAMNATTFDSLSAARRLQEAGLEQGPAEAIAETLCEATAANRDDLATKTDLAVIEVRLKAEMSTTANRIIVTILIASGVLLAALKLF